MRSILLTPEPTCGLGSRDPHAATKLLHFTTKLVTMCGQIFILSHQNVNTGLLSLSFDVSQSNIQHILW